MRLALHQHGVIAALEQVAGAAVAPVEGLRVDPAEVAHPLAEIGRQRLDHQVVVVAHQAVGVAQPSAPGDGAPEQIEKVLPVGIILIDSRSSVAAPGHVVQGALELEA
jgi:hypothetical protein